MNYIQLLNDLCINVFNKEISRSEVIDYLHNSGLIEKIYKEVSKIGFYTLDGRLDDILDKIIYLDSQEKLVKFDSFTQFIDVVEKEIQDLYVPVVLIFPLNLARKSKDFSEQNFKNENIKIFPVYKEYGIFSRKINSIDQYIESNVYMKLLPEHIKITKDSDFFNYPLMTILFRGIEYSISQKAPKIIEAICSIIRMTTFKKTLGNKRIRFDDMASLSTTFAVYYNQPGTLPTPPYSNGYGYSHKTSFYNILDVSIDDIELVSDEISDLITKLNSLMFCNTRSIDKDIIAMKEKWINALLLFNEAYELASRENFDTANIILLTILESLFLKRNTRGSKMKLLIDNITPKVKNQFTDKFVEDVITSTYRNRNDFVHEGIGMKRYTSYKKTYDFSALIGGLEPLEFIVNKDDEKLNDLQALNSLFELVIYCIVNDYQFDL